MAHMRFRFSLRWMLIAFTVLSVFFYVLFIRPTVIANRFVTAIRNGDFETAESLCSGTTPHFLTEAIKENRKPVWVGAKLTPRTWGSLSRGIVVDVISSEVGTNTADGGKMHLGHRMEAVAGIASIRKVSDSDDDPTAFQSQYVEKIKSEFTVVK